MYRNELRVYEVIDVTCPGGRVVQFRPMEGAEMYYTCPSLPSTVLKVLHGATPEADRYVFGEIYNIDLKLDDSTPDLAFAKFTHTCTQRAARLLQLITPIPPSLKDILERMVAEDAS